MKLWRFSAFLGGLTAVIVALAVVSEPETTELVAIEIADGQRIAAAEAIDEAQNAGAGDPALWLRRADLYRFKGDVEALGEALEAFAAAHPEALAARNALAQYYFQERRIGPALEQAEAAYRLDPTAGRLKRLIGWARSAGLYQIEARLLEEGIETRLLAHEAVERTIRLFRSLGRSQRLLALLRRIDRAPELMSPAGRAALFDLALAQGDVDDAMARASRWLAENRDAVLLARNVGSLLRRNRLAEAESLATSALDVAPDAALATVGVFAASAAIAPGRRLLIAWARGLETLSPEQQRRLVEAGTAVNDPSLALALLSQYGLDRVAPEPIAALAAALFERFGIRGVQPLRARLTPAVLARRPLFAAELAFAERRPEIAEAYLRQAPGRALSASERKQLAALVSRLEPAARRVRLMRELLQRGALSPDLARGVRPEP